MTPLEEQLEKLARKWEKDADVLEGLAPKGTWVNGASTARREDANQLRALLPLEVTDEMVEAGAKAMLTHERPWMDGQHPENQAGGIERRREAARACLSAALTQKGDNE